MRTKERDGILNAALDEAWSKKRNFIPTMILWKHDTTVLLCFSHSDTIHHASSAFITDERSGKGIDRCIRHEFETIAVVAADERQKDTRH